LKAHILGGREGGRICTERGYVAVIVDALRASATISSLMAFGVRDLEVVEHTKEALAERAARPGVTLFGERGGYQVEGFDYGNSPFQAPVDPMPDPIVFTSSNCSRCCIAAADAPVAFLGTTVNASAVARLAHAEAARLGADICFITAGSAENVERFVMEDHLAAAVIIRRLQAIDEGIVAANDAARAGLILLDSYGEDNLEAAFLQTDNGSRLSQRMAFGDDVRFASRVNVFDVAARIVGVRPLAGGGKATRLAVAR
jgi:2-phosphosulfolactate phosphatase